MPVVDLPEYDYEYPILNIPPEPIVVEAQTPQTGGGGAGEGEEIEETDTRDLPQAPAGIEGVVPGPTIDIGGVEIPLPDVGVVATAGSIAVVTTAAGLGASIVFTQAKNALTPMINELVKKKFKVKIKNVKPVLHYVLTEDGNVQIFEYSKTGTKLVDTTDKVEQYIRDQVEINSLYEYDNKILIDEGIKSQLTKEGQKRFASLFVAPQKLAKKLGAKFSF